MNKPSDWMQMQQDLWRAWQSILKQTQLGGGTGDGLGGFGRQFGFDPGGANGPMGAFAALFNPWFTPRPEALGPEAFTQWFSSAVQEMLRTSAASTRNDDTPLDAMNEFLRSPVRMWQAMLAQGSNPFDGMDWPGMAPSEFAALQDLPPLGLTREWAASLRDLRIAYGEQVDAGNALGRQIGYIYQTALKRFTKAVSDGDSDDGEITSLRQLYDLWVSIAEQAYSEKVMTTEYSQTFGKFINASARSRKAWQKLVDDVQESMNLPNRRELDSVIARQHATQAELRALAAQSQDGLEFDALKNRVDALSEQLDGLTIAAQQAAEPTKTKKEAKGKAAMNAEVEAHANSKAPAKKRAKAASTSRAAPASKVKRSTPKPRAKRPAPAPSAGEFDIGSFAGEDRH